MIKRFVFLLCILLSPIAVSAAPDLSNDISGYVKSLNYFTESTGLSPEFVDFPLSRTNDREDLFISSERVRLKTRTTLDWKDQGKLILKLDYDHQPDFGSFVSSGDYRIARTQSERRQFLDLSQTLVEKDGARYEHRLYRASLLYQLPDLDLEIGRQQIPWGVGHFFTPVDFFNPFNPTQLELDERDGVDAIRLETKKIPWFKTEFIYTPTGRQLHPQRFMTRISRDVAGYEIGLLGGRVKRDHPLGFDFSGNLGGGTLRGEFIYREAELEKDFIRFTLNADYNLPHNIYVLLEYHFNGQGRRNSRDYQMDRFVRGEIQQMAKNYLAATLGYDLTPLLRFENRVIFNLDDVSFFLRPELQYELTENLVWLAALQIYLGASTDEFGMPGHLYLTELKYSF